MVCEAKELAKADTFGSADPYVKVTWNHLLIGQTAVIKNTLTPLWGEDEKFILNVADVEELAQYSLYLEVWDWDRVGAGNFLGCSVLEGDALTTLIEGSKFAPTWLDLKKSPYLPDALQELVQGQVQVRLGFAGLQVESDTAIKFDVTIVSAEDLPRADGMFGLSDPFG